jgi:hypothetical protein
MSPDVWRNSCSRGLYPRRWPERSVVGISPTYAESVRSVMKTKRGYAHKEVKVCIHVQG